MVLQALWVPFIMYSECIDRIPSTFHHCQSRACGASLRHAFLCKNTLKNLFMIHLKCMQLFSRRTVAATAGEGAARLLPISSALTRPRKLRDVCVLWGRVREEMENVTQCEVAFSAPRPVWARTANSSNFASAVGSRPISEPRIAAKNPSGMLTMPGLLSGKRAVA